MECEIIYYTLSIYIWGKIFFVLGMPTTIDDKNGQNNTKIINANVK